MQGTTVLMTFSFRASLISSRQISSSCWTEMTIVCTRTGSMAPRSWRYWTVTCREDENINQWNGSDTNKKRLITSQQLMWEAYLSLWVWPKPWKSTIATQFRHLGIQLVGKDDSERHALLCLICSIPKHQALQRKSFTDFYFQKKKN